MDDTLDYFGIKKLANKLVKTLWKEKLLKSTLY